jgi:hypothetical protein
MQGLQPGQMARNRTTPRVLHGNGDGLRLRSDRLVDMKNDVAKRLLLVRSNLEELHRSTELDLDNLKVAGWKKEVPRADFEYLMQAKRHVMNTVRSAINEINQLTTDVEQ